MTIRVIARDHILDEGFELEIGEEMLALSRGAGSENHGRLSNIWPKSANASASVPSPC